MLSSIPRLGHEVPLTVGIGDVKSPDRRLYRLHFVRRVHKPHKQLAPAPATKDAPTWCRRAIKLVPVWLGTHYTVPNALHQPLHSSSPTNLEPLPRGAVGSENQQYQIWRMP